MEGLDIKSGEHEELRELCAVSVSERLSVEEEERLSAHLAICDDCRTKLGQYRAIEQFGLPMAASEDLKDEELAAVPREQEQKTLKRLLDQCVVGAVHFPLREKPLGAERGMFRKRARTFTPAFAAILRYAAGILIAVTLFFMGYRVAVERIRKNELALRTASNEVVTSAQTLAASLSVERDELKRKLEEKNAGEAKLLANIQEQELEIQGLTTVKRELEENNAHSEMERSKVNAERDVLLGKLSGAEQDLARLKSDLDSLHHDGERESAQVAALDARIAQLTKQLNARDETISQERELLASDRDIRELMGARELFITEVHDVGRDGKTEKPFARVFYTKGKSLIFYAYDLDRQAGIKTASTFQAWGVRDGDQKQPLNLGIFYSDSVAKKRWVLRFDDPKTVDELNAVFVTMEPNGGSSSPSGKQLLFAYLRVRPNHP
jgi:hypothetical protein